ncbi:MAG: DUF554 domain-containing protein [Ruminococcaceae bacterium]|nr:DUF554 domain-containing protein [Oscillospiraceae bacterium]
MLTGSIVNFFAILAGAVVGLFAGRLLTPKLEKALMGAIGLIVIGISVPGMMESQNTLVAILSLVLGTLIGEALDLDRRINQLGDFLQSKFKGQGKFSEGFVTASLVFVVGAMAILGGLKSGLQNDHTILITKSIIDGITSIVFASTLGIGVAFSAIPVFLWQGGIALLASVVSPVFTDPVMAEISFVGSLLIAAIGTNLLGITKLKIMNMTPAALLPIVLCHFL